MGFTVRPAEHKTEYDHQHDQSKPYGSVTEKVCAEAAGNGAAEKHGYDGQKTAGLVQGTFFFPYKKTIEKIYSAAQVAGAHSCGASCTFDLAEGLHLNRTGKRDHGSGHNIAGTAGDKSHKEHQDDFQTDCYLSPVKKFLRDSIPDKICQKNSDNKGNNRDSVCKCLKKIPLGKIHGKKYQISRLTVGKDLIPADERIRFQKSACNSKQRDDRNGFRQLNVIAHDKSRLSFLNPFHYKRFQKSCKGYFTDSIQMKKEIRADAADRSENKQRKPIC